VDDYEADVYVEKDPSIWEQLAMTLIGGSDKFATLSPSQINDYVQYISLLRVGIPALC
jgi:hypothetical protein